MDRTLFRSLRLVSALLVSSTTVMAQEPRQDRAAPLRSCTTLDEPTTLPAADQLVDSAAVARAAAALPATDRPVDILVSFRMGRSGIDSIWLLRATPDGRPADQLFASVRAAGRPASNLDLVGIRLRLTLDSTLQLTTERSELCVQPNLAEVAAIGRIRVSVVAGAAPPAFDNPRIRIRIGADGSARSAMIITSSGNRELDREIQRIASQGRYLPALLDGHPVEIWLEAGRFGPVRP